MKVIDIPVSQFFDWEKAVKEAAALPTGKGLYITMEDCNSSSPLSMRQRAYYARLKTGIEVGTSLRDDGIVLTPWSSEEQK